MNRTDSHSNTMLYAWKIKEFVENNEKYKILYGIVTGHSHLKDWKYIHTSDVVSYRIDYAAGCLIAQTLNSVYYCKLKYMDYVWYADHPESKPLIPNFEDIEKKYSPRSQAADNTPEPGSILVEVADFDDYYFHAVHCRSLESAKEMDFTAYPQVHRYILDNFVILGEGVEIEYFLHEGTIELYVVYTALKPLYFKNIGISDIRIITWAGPVVIKPGECAKICTKDTWLAEGEELD